MMKRFLPVVLLLSTGFLEASAPSLARSVRATVGMLRRGMQSQAQEALASSPVVVSLKKVPQIGLAVIDNSGTSGDKGCKKPQIPFTRAWASMSVPESITKYWTLEYMGLAKRDQIAKMALVPEIRERFIEANGHAPTEDDINYMHDEVFVPEQLEAILEGFEIIEGAADAEHKMRNRGILIGSSTGYNAVSNGVAIHKLIEQGAHRDFWVVPSDVIGGRPGPWMIQKNRELAFAKTGEYIASHRTIKFDDTRAGVQEGVNDDCWSIGISYDSIRVNLDKQEEAELMSRDPKLLKSIRDNATQELYQAGAHIVIPTMASADLAVEFINMCMHDVHCRPQTFKQWANDKSISLNDVLFE
ncbi:MAG: phosphonoacetaldehyde hydrolase [Alteromonas naphthalenivorans]|jgi:phosphonoacetaldehyde hydrolase